MTTAIVEESAWQGKLHRISVGCSPATTVMSFAGLIQSTLRAVMLPSAAPWFILVVALPAVPAELADLEHTSDLPSTELSDFGAAVGWLTCISERKP